MVGTESGRTRRAPTAVAGPRLDWREGPDGVLNAAREGWEARIRRNATGEYELTTYHEASEPTQVPGAPHGLLFRPIASFTRHRLLGRAKAVAEAYLQLNADEPEPTPSGMSVAWVTVAPDPVSDREGLRSAEQPAQYVAPVAPGGPFRWWCGCAVSGECRTTLEAYLSASAHGEAHRAR